MNEQSRKWTNRTCAVSAMKMPQKTWATLNNPKHPLTIVRVAGGEDVIAAVWGAKVSEERPNADLIAEAFNVATETGLTPRQLAERVVELEAALRNLAAFPEHEFALENKPDTYNLWRANDWQLALGDVRLARAALRTTNTP